MRRGFRFAPILSEDAGVAALLSDPAPESASRAASARLMPIRARFGDRGNRCCPTGGARFERGGGEVGEYASSGTSPGVAFPGAAFSGAGR